jgi:imidazolonepropionase
MEVHEAGGGINYTVEHTKKASEEELYTLLADRITRMIKSGKKLQMKNLCEKTIKFK